MISDLGWQSSEVCELRHGDDAESSYEYPVPSGAKGFVCWRGGYIALHGPMEELL